MDIHIWNESDASTLSQNLGGTWPGDRSTHRASFVEWLSFFACSTVPTVPNTNNALLIPLGKHNGTGAGIRDKCHSNYGLNAAWQCHVTLQNRWKWSIEEEDNIHIIHTQNRQACWIVLIFYDFDDSVNIGVCVCLRELGTIWSSGPSAWGCWLCGALEEYWHSSGVTQCKAMACWELKAPPESPSATGK